MTYEDLLHEADNEHLTVKEKPLQGSDGRISRNRIAIRRNISTTTEKTCVLAEELGHHYTSTGNIIDLTDPNSRKQECRARLWGYNRLIGLVGIIKAFEHGCRSRYEMAEFLGVTEEFLDDALKAYQSKYGVCTTVDNYTIYFTPSLAVVRFGD